MKTTFLLLRGYFDLVPLQRWINLLSLLLLAAALLAGLYGRANGTLGFTLLGVTLLGLAPALLGGVALRFASTRSVLYLKPYGRFRLLMAATAALTLLALLFTLPFCIELWLDIPGRGARRIEPAHAFAIAWSGLALLWICVFAVSHSMYTFGLVGLIPVAVMTISRVLVPHLPHPAWLMLPAAAAWLGFIAWHLRTDFVARPQLASSTQAALDGGSFKPLHRLFNSMTPKGELSARQTQYMYLLGGLPSMFAITGVWITALFFLIHLLAQWFGPPSRHGSFGPQSLLFMLPFLGFFMFSLGFNTVRRARYLWLRERLDRPALFGLAGQLGLRASFSGWGVTAALIAVVELLRDPGNVGFIPLFVLAHAALAVCLFYAGMAMTRTWSLRDVTLGAVIWIGFVVQLYHLSPDRNPRVETALILVVVNVIFALLLRGYASRIWRGLDWRVTTLPRPAERRFG